jgi:hypothetical protein
MALNDELAARLAAQGVGTVSANIFMGSNARLPELGKSPYGDGPFITIIEYGGMSPLYVHNSETPHVSRPTAQIMARGLNYGTTRAMAVAAFNALVNVKNQMLSGVFYQQIRARQEPTDMGHDNVGRLMIGFNIEAMKQPS